MSDIVDGYVLRVRKDSLEVEKDSPSHIVHIFACEALLDDEDKVSEIIRFLPNEKGIVTTLCGNVKLNENELALPFEVTLGQKMRQLADSLKRLNNNNFLKFKYGFSTYSTYGIFLNQETLRVFAAYSENRYSNDFSFCGNCIGSLYKTEKLVQK